MAGSFDQNNIDFHMTCLLPTDWKVLPLSYFAYTNQGVKRKNP